MSKEFTKSPEQLKTKDFDGYSDELGKIFTAEKELIPVILGGGEEAEDKLNKLFEIYWGYIKKQASYIFSTRKDYWIVMGIHSSEELASELNYDLFSHFKQLASKWVQKQEVPFICMCLFNLKRHLQDAGRPIIGPTSRTMRHYAWEEREAKRWVRVEQQEGEKGGRVGIVTEDLLESLGSPMINPDNLAVGLVEAERILRNFNTCLGDYIDYWMIRVKKSRYAKEVKEYGQKYGQIIIDYLFKGLTLKESAQRQGLTEARGCQLVTDFKLWVSKYKQRYEIDEIESIRAAYELLQIHRPEKLLF
jgi:hypothetical protein